MKWSILSEDIPQDGPLHWGWLKFFVAAIAEKVGGVRVTLKERAVLDRVPDALSVAGDER